MWKTDSNICYDVHMLSGLLAVISISQPTFESVTFVSYSYNMALRICMTYLIFCMSYIAYHDTNKTIDIRLPVIIIYNKIFVCLLYAAVNVSLNSGPECLPYSPNIYCQWHWRDLQKKINDYCTCVPNNIVFDDTIPTNYCKDVGFSSIINKYYRHPSIVKLNRNTLNKTLFQFERIYSQDVKIINCFDCKKAPSYDKVPLKLVQKCAKYIAPDFAKLINASFQMI